MSNNSKELCIGCGAFDVEIFVEPKYNGLRGRCLNCLGDWPES